MTIHKWLESFASAWKSHDIEAVMALFEDEVEYWETPYKLISGKQSLREEWGAIHNQSNIQISTDLFPEHENNYAVRWKLTYENQNSELQNWAGTYLITLNEEGKCLYFHHTGEKNVE